ncbi:MAG: aromatic amino acid lyase [Pseudomonadota bacterium]
MAEGIQLGRDHLEPDNVAEVAREARPVVLSEETRDLVSRARAVLERYEREDRPVYGLTRGLGNQVENKVSQEDRDGYSRLMMVARACGTGPELPRPAVRAALFARAAGMAQGGSGVRPQVIDQIIKVLQADICPVVPSIGSVGASDLPLMANLGLGLIGEGLVIWRGQRMPASEALREAGIAPLSLAAKEGVAICAANAISTGMGALVHTDCHRLLEALEAVVILSFEAFRANPSPLDGRIAAARPAPGQVLAAERLRAKWMGSDLFQDGAPRRLQDPISLRCVSHVHGSLFTALEAVRAHLLGELNGAGDNPLVMVEGEEILSTGNFHTPGMALSFDSLALAVHQVASLSSNRLRRISEAKLTDLPERLTTRQGLRIGLAMLSLNAQCLVKEIARLGQPASLATDSLYDVEDDCPMTLAAVRKAEEALGHLAAVIACELMVAAQALDLRAPDRVCAVAGAIHDAVREEVDYLDDDRSLTEDLTRATDLVRSGRLNRVLGAALGQGPVSFRSHQAG